MVRWYEEGEVKAKPGTWSGLIGRYKSDDISPLQEVQPNTRKSYLEHIAYWEPVLGDEPVEDFDFAEAKRIEKGMRDNGRSRSFIKKRFTMLRMIVGYGVAIKWAHAASIRDVLSEAISAGGSSLRDFRQADGELGYFQHNFDVYGREGEPCRTPECTSQIKRITQSGRSSFFCAQCQR